MNCKQCGSPGRYVGQERVAIIGGKTHQRFAYQCPRSGRFFSEVRILKIVKLANGSTITFNGSTSGLWGS